MAYELNYVPGVLKSMKRLPGHVARRIVNKLEDVRDDPRGHGAIKLSGEEAYRVRVGDYRIIYTINDRVLTVLVIEIGHRGDVYR